MLAVAEAARKVKMLAAEAGVAAMPSTERRIVAERPAALAGSAGALTRQRRALGVVQSTGTEWPSRTTREAPEARGLQVWRVHVIEMSFFQMSF